MGNEDRQAVSAVVIWLYATGKPTAGTLLLIGCGALVGSIDNVLRPRLVGGDAKMSDLLILISILDGRPPQLHNSSRSRQRPEKPKP